MPAFDTSALVPLFDSRHKHHGEARRLFEKAPLALLHPCVIEELTRVIRRLAKDHGQDGNGAARKALAALLAEPRVRIEAALPYGAVVDSYRSDSALSFTDAVVAHMGWSHGRQEPVAFDGRITRAWKRAGKGKGG